MPKNRGYGKRKSMRDTQRTQVPHIMSGPNRFVSTESKFTKTNPKQYMSGGVKNS